MPAERVSMRKIREVLRLTHALGMSRRLVGEATGIGKTAVGEYVRRAAVAGLSWPIPDGIDDAELERRLFPPADAGSSAARTDPDWSHIHAEMKRRGVTLALLWQEYRGEHAEGYAYSWFCERYSDWRKRITPTMRQTHVAGEKLFVDWAGDAIPVFDPITGAEHGARIFVAALGASNYTYAEARWTETLPDWIGAHVNALSAIGGVPKAVVCDNLKAGITKPSRYEPGINRTYQDLADHYGFVVLPTRVRKPRDKAKVEVAVLIVERFVLAKLRNRRFFSLDELNAEVRECVATINAKVMKKLAKSRRRAAGDDRPSGAQGAAERALSICRVEALRCRARLPRRGRRPLLLGAVPAVARDRRGAAHRRHGRGLPQRSFGLRAIRGRACVNRHTTIPEHMPSSHRRYAEWTPQRMMREAAKIGPATIALVEAIMKAKPHPEQGFRSCLGIMRLVRTYGTARVEAASRRGNDIGATTYGSIASILKTGLDKAYANSKAPDGPPIRHANIRGRGYYH